MNDEDKRLEQVFADPQYGQHSDEIKRLNLERYNYCATIVDKMRMHGAVANDPSDQHRVDQIDERIATLRGLISEIYNAYDVPERS